MADPKINVFTPEFWNHTLDGLVRWAGTSGLRVVLTLVLFFIGLRVARAFVHRAVKIAVRPQGKDALRDLMVTKRQATLIGLFDAVVTITLILIAAMLILPDIGFHVEPILASAGIAGIALGFGAQSLVKDLLSGVFIILEQQFSVGDVVKVSGVSGAVEEITLRTTVLRDGDGSVHIIPNGQITQATVLTRDWSRLVLDLDVAYDADLDQAGAVLKRELEAYAATNPDIVLEPAEFLGVESLAESSVRLRASVKVMPGKQWTAGRQLRGRIKKAFDAAGIEIPFPQRTLWVRQEKTATEI